MSSIFKLLRSSLRLKTSCFTSSIYNSRVLGSNFVKYYNSRARHAIFHKNSTLIKFNTISFRNVHTEQIERQSRSKIPEELWVLLIVGLGGVGIFYLTYYKKREIQFKKRNDVQLALAEAKRHLQNEEKEEAYKLLKNALIMIHNEIEQKLKDPSKKGKRPFHKALKYVLDQSANLAIELEKWDEAEHYLRLTLQELISTGTPKNDDAAIELSLKLSQACEKQGKNDLAAEGYQWCVDTAEENVDQADEADDNSKALLGLCYDGLGMFQLSLGQTDKAISNLESALEIAEEVLGHNDEQTLVIMNNLAKAYAEGNRYDEAEKLVLKTIKLAEEADSDFKAIFMANLGEILLEKGKVVRAKKAFIKAFKLADETDDEVTKSMIKDSLMKLDINVGHG